jgi:hypothetical protein
MNSLLLAVLLAAVVIAWATSLLVAKVPLTIALMKPITWAFTAMGVAAFAFDRWIWRLPFLYPQLVRVPDLQGTWKGQVISNWIDPATGSKKPPIEAFLAIRQTYFSIHMRLITKESQSHILAGKIFCNVDETCEIAGIFRNTPRMTSRDVSPIHNGGVLLRVQGDSRFTLEGDYWTDRDTKGELRFTEKAKDVFHDFERAAVGRYESQL